MIFVPVSAHPPASRAGPSAKEYLLPIRPQPKSQPAADGGMFADDTQLWLAIANSLAEQERDERQQGRDKAREEWQRDGKAQAGGAEGAAEEETEVEEEAIEQRDREAGGAGSAGSSAAHAAEGVAAEAAVAEEAAVEETDDLTCAICRCECEGEASPGDGGEEGWGYTPCGHCFHLSCIFGWVKMPDRSVPSTRGDLGDVRINNKSCPTCRAPLSSSTKRVLTAEAPPGKRPRET